jgi:hypothetical protein
VMPIPHLLLGGSDCCWCDMGDLEGLFPDAKWADYLTARLCFARQTKAHRIPLAWPGIVVAVNDIGCHFPGRIDHWCSIHPEKFKRCGTGPTYGRWTQRRKAARYNTDYLTWGQPNKAKFVDRTLKQWISHGSSGLYAAAVARDGLGAEKAILCGVGMTNGPHFVGSVEHPHGKAWTSVGLHLPRLESEAVQKHLAGDWLRSMSGRTCELLGAPDKAWLQSQDEQAA